MRWILSLLIFLPGIALPQAQPLQTERMFLFPNGLALTIKEGTLNFDHSRVLIEDIPAALFKSFWLNPAGDYNILKTVYGADTVLVDAEARTFFEVLKANVAKEARVTYKVGSEIEDVEGEILSFGIDTELARIRRATGGTIFIHKDQILMVSINDAYPRSRYQEMRIGNSTAVELDRTFSKAKLQAFFFQKGFSWEPAYSLRLMSDRQASLSMKAVITNQGSDVDQTNIKLVIGTPIFRSDKGIDASARELVSALPSYAFPNPVSTHNLVQVITGEEEDMQGNQGKALLTPASLGYDGRTQPGEMYIMDAGSVSLKKNSKAYLPVFTKNIAVKQTYSCRVPNFIDTLKKVDYSVPTQVVDVYHTIELENKMDLPLLEGSVFISDETGTTLGQDNITYTGIGDTFKIQISKVLNIMATNKEEVFAYEEKVKLEDKSTADRVIIRGVIELNNLDKKPAIIQLEKTVMGTVNRKSGASITEMGSSRGKNKVIKLEWSIPVAGSNTQRVPYEYSFYVN